MPQIAKNFTKEYHSVLKHVFHHFYDMALITACLIVFPSLNLLLKILFTNPFLFIGGSVTPVVI